MVPLKPLPRIASSHRELPARLRPASTDDGCLRCPGCAAAGTAASARCGVPLKRLRREEEGR